MKTIKAVLDSARRTWADENTGDPTFWSDVALLEYLNDGRKDLYGAKPSLYEVTQDVTLLAGWRHSLPNGSKKLFRIIHNVSHEERRDITVVDREILGRSRPKWRWELTSDEMLHYMYTGTEPSVFECYPPLDAGVVVRMSYARPPVDYTLDQLNGISPPTLDAEAELAVALIDYVLHRMYQKQADTAPGYAQRSEAHLALFSGRVSGTEQSRQASNPNVTTRASNPKAAAG